MKRFDVATGKPEPRPWSIDAGLRPRGRPDLRRDAARARCSACASRPTPRRPSGSIRNGRSCRLWPMRGFPVASTASTAATACGDGRVAGQVVLGPRSRHLLRSTNRRRKTWTIIGARTARHRSPQMATLDLHRIKARDGLELPVWVTTPPGAGAAPRPAVVLVHGGPWVRGDALALERRRAVPGLARLRRHRARVPRQHRLRRDALPRRLARTGERRCRTTSPTRFAGRPHKGIVDRQARLHRRRELRRLRGADGHRSAIPTCTAAASPGSRSAIRACCSSRAGSNDISARGARVFDADTDRRPGQGRRRCCKAAAPVERAAEIKIPLLHGVRRRATSAFPSITARACARAMRAAGQRARVRRLQRRRPRLAKGREPDRLLDTRREVPRQEPQLISREQRHVHASDGHDGQGPRRRAEGRALGRRGRRSRRRSTRASTPASSSRPRTGCPSTTARRWCARSASTPTPRSSACCPRATGSAARRP